MMKKFWILFGIGCALLACDEASVDFSYSPTQPRAGQKVLFTNLSTGGEDWAWSFGDAITSTSKNPTHIYTRPGTYVVSLMMDNKSSLKKVIELQVFDTVPNFSCDVDSVDSIGLNIFEDVTFTAEIYNPFSYDLTYEWSVVGDVPYQAVSANNTSESWQIYFTQPASDVLVQLRATQNGEETIVLHSYTVNDVAATAVLMGTQDKEAYRHRIYGSRAEVRQEVTYPEGLLLLAQAQDSFQIYNDHTYYLSELQQTLPNLLGFKVASRKIYARTAFGLCVANLPDASDLVTIDTHVPSALTIDVIHNRLYWANANGVYYMPLINSDNNRFTTTPVQLDSLGTVVKLAIDTIAR